MKEYKALLKAYRISVGDVGSRTFERQVNKLSAEGWVVKFSNVSTVDSSYRASSKEPQLVFYALFEKEK